MSPESTDFDIPAFSAAIDEVIYPDAAADVEETIKGILDARSADEN